LGEDRSGRIRRVSEVAEPQPASAEGAPDKEGRSMATKYTTAGTVRSLCVRESKVTLTITSAADHSIKAPGSKTRLNVFKDTIKKGKARLFKEDKLKIKVDAKNTELIRMLAEAHGASRLLVFHVKISASKLLGIEFPPPKPSDS
jgi:hypothetical protein